MSTQTLLDAVNKVLRRTGETQSDLDSLIDSGHQIAIEQARGIWTDIVHEVASLGVFSAESGTGSITLAEGSVGREYDLPQDFEGFSGEWETAVLTSPNHHKVFEYKGGYTQMVADQTNPDDYKGDPLRWAINPTNGKLRIDVNPEAAQAGRVYTFVYEKRIALLDAQSTFPFSDTVIDALTPAVEEMFLAKRRKQFSSAMMRKAVIIALRYIRQKRSNTSYATRTRHQVQPERAW